VSGLNGGYYTVPVYTPRQFDERLHAMEGIFHKEPVSHDPGDILGNTRMNVIAEGLEKASLAMQSPQQRMEHGLSPWVTFGVIPLFALANAGLDIVGISLRKVILEPVTMGIVLGLVFGKFLGITCFAWLAVKTGLSRLPSDVRWRHITGAAWLGGIGFTMSLFIGRLAFAGQPSFFENVRTGILLASLISAIIGLLWLYFGDFYGRDNSRSGD
jgi:Na+:H+ antiporter, NhaA family